MHPSILAKRKAEALVRITAATGVERPKGVKDPAAAEMMFLERLADHLEQAPAVPAVTAVTAEPVPAPTLEALPPPVVEPPAVEPEPEPQKPARKTRRTKKP